TGCAGSAAAPGRPCPSDREERYGTSQRRPPCPPLCSSSPVLVFPCHCPPLSLSSPVLVLACARPRLCSSSPVLVFPCHCPPLCSSSPVLVLACASSPVF